MKIFSKQMCMYMMSQDPSATPPEGCEKYFPAKSTFISTTKSTTESTLPRTQTDYVPKTAQIDLNVTPTQFEPEKTASNPTTTTKMTSKTTSTPTKTTTTPTKAILAANIDPDWEDILAQWIKQWPLVAKIMTGVGLVISFLLVVSVCCESIAKKIRDKYPGRHIRALGCLEDTGHYLNLLRLIFEGLRDGLAALTEKKGDSQHTETHKETQRLLPAGPRSSRQDEPYPLAESQL